MGDYSPPETTAQKLETLRRMAAETETYRLSINEIAAIKYALRRLATLERKLSK
jgi:hypothetical protein